jgi:uncharacterized protein
MLLVSIHDVSPAQAAAVTQLWTICATRGVKPALLVVPDWHGEWPLESHPDFVAWLRARSEEGVEIVLHGERHDELGTTRNLKDQFRAWGKTDREGEFLSLDQAAAQERVCRGLSRLRKLGLDPKGFVPPAWLAGEGTFRAVSAAGLSFSEDDRSIRIFPSGKRVRSPVVRWSGRTALRARGSIAIAALRTVFQRRARFPRIALHPRDLDRPALARSVEWTLEHWLQRHPAGRYADLPQRVLSS